MKIINELQKLLDNKQPLMEEVNPLYVKNLKTLEKYCNDHLIPKLKEWNEKFNKNTRGLYLPNFKNIVVDLEGDLIYIRNFQWIDVSSGALMNKHQSNDIRQRTQVEAIIEDFMDELDAVFHLDFDDNNFYELDSNEICMCIASSKLYKIDLDSLLYNKNESINEDNETKTLDYFINKLENRYPIDFEQRELGLYIFNSKQTTLSWDDEFKLIKAMRRGWKDDNDTQKYYAEKSLKSTIKEANKIAKNLRKQAKEQKNKNESIKESEELKVGDIANWNNVVWVKINSIDGNKANVSPIHQEDIDSGKFEKEEIVLLSSLKKSNESIKEDWSVEDINKYNKERITKVKQILEKQFKRLGFTDVKWNEAKQIYFFKYLDEPYYVVINTPGINGTGYDIYKAKEYGVAKGKLLTYRDVWLMPEDVAPFVSAILSDIHKFILVNDSIKEEFFVGNDEYIIVPVSYVYNDIRILDKKTGEFLKDENGDNLKFSTEEECGNYIKSLDEDLTILEETLRKAEDMKKSIKEEQEKISLKDINNWFESKTLLGKQNDPEFYIRSAVRKWPQLKGHEKELRDNLAKEKAKNHPWYPYTAMVTNTLAELGLFEPNKNESIKEDTYMDKYKPMYDKATELAQDRAKIDFVSKMNPQELVDYAVKAIKQNDASISDVENMLNKANHTPGQIEDILDKIRTSLDEACYKSIKTKTNTKSLIERLEKLTEETVDILIPGASSIIKDKVNELGLKDCIISTEDFFGDKPHSAKDGVLFRIKPECKQQFVDAIDEYGLKYEVFCEELTSALRKIAESEQYKRI